MVAHLWCKTMNSYKVWPPFNSKKVSLAALSNQSSMTTKSFNFKFKPPLNIHYRVFLCAADTWVVITSHFHTSMIIHPFAKFYPLSPLLPPKSYHVKIQVTAWNEHRRPSNDRCLLLPTVAFLNFWVLDLKCKDTSYIDFTAWFL